MPLVRLELRNEYGLGDPELYRGGFRKEEPKAILDGVAVSGLVGILRQLGDLAEFAADVFHDLHEQIMATAVRGRQMMTRVQNIESTVPSIEKAFGKQTSYLHFAYVAGSDWHARIRDEQSSLLSTELPRFMMDSYEECRDPPRLFLLDKFDHAGTGACLKRYSDPPYFKRVWTASQMEISENFQKEKKVHKTKRKGSRPRHGEVKHAVYISHDDSSGIGFASSSIDGQRFSAVNISSPDMRLNLEFLSRSTSFASKTRENYAEQTSYVNPHGVPDDLDYSEVPNRKLHSKDSHLSVPVLHDKPSADGLDSVAQHDSPQEQSVPRSSSVTWDEKTEIVKSTSPLSYNDILVDRVEDLENVINVQDSETLQVNFKTENIEHAKIEALNQEDILCHIGKTSVPLSGVSHFDEVSSETDNYVDAPNTMDSESETEAGCHTKSEMQTLSNVSSQGMEPRKEMGQVIAVQSSEPSDVEAPNSSHSSLNQDVTPKSLHLSSLNGSEHVQSPYVTKFVRKQEQTVVDDFCERNAPDISETKNHAYECIDSVLSPISGTFSSPTMMLAETRCEGSILKHDPLADVSGVPSIKLWTNGGLFGVEPSKPPELGAVNTQTFMQNEPTSVDANSQGKVAGEPTNLDSSVQRNSTEDHFFARGYNTVQKFKGSPSCHDNQHVGNVKQDSHVSNEPFLQRKFEHNSEDTDISNYASSDKLDMTRNSASSGAPLTDIYCTGSRQNGPSQSTVGISSSFSELAQRFLANTIHREASLSTPSGNTNNEIRKPKGRTSCLHDNREVSNEVASQRSYEQNTNEKVAHVPAKEPVSFTSYYHEQSSPPLEYMKISFQPMNGLDNSKLKYYFSSGSLHENSEDATFPTFQLHQGPVDNLPVVLSESDDDTFHRSCPYSSEELLSPRSYTSSEQWEQEGRSEYVDHELNDIPYRFQSSTTSISRSMGFEQMNHSSISKPDGLENFEAIIDSSKVPFRSVSAMELPRLDSVLSVKNQQERKFPSLREDPANVEVQSTNELPPPPPLPPMQWRTFKPSIKIDDNDPNISSNLNHLDDSQPLRCPSQIKEQYSPGSPFVNGPISPHPDKIQDQPKLTWEKRSTRSVSHKEVDRREDLLDQIRNKSLNLRRAKISMTRDIPRPKTSITNANVATILEKASAIRQAFVGSDEGGDDDNWTDA
ncbi:SCAR-like protein [Musa troglodytarum]|uniref:Protein SCAR n=1 Tax=Musa troglodytarum TaxID=320322 RepID=A0A9E7LAT6_9LILI|nr:SCAR-like protein [Musa troglodytarum]URE44136.1 SCAR-like protein [Musa troglodytarum]